MKAIENLLGFCFYFNQLNTTKNNLTKKAYIFLLLFTLSFAAYAQQNEPFIQEQKAFLALFSNQKTASTLKLQVSKSKALEVLINKKTNDNNFFEVIGNVDNEATSTIHLKSIDGKIDGAIIMPNQNIAYKIYSDDQGNVITKPESIHKHLCVRYALEDTNEEKDIKGDISSAQKAANNLESLPGSPYVIYLDFDGEVVSGTSWLGGATINAAPRNYSDIKIFNIWEIMAEDFRSFDVNVTTNRAIFDNTPTSRKMMVIFTPTNDAAPGAGGVAYLRSFGTRNPCWVFNNSTKSAGESGSHEVGHTIGLGHDGEGNRTYYGGNGNWGPIMGTPFGNTIIGHWSKGDYPNSNNSQNDYAIMENYIPFLTDSHGSSINDAIPLVHNNGTLDRSNNRGIIEINTDQDYFTFTTSGGTVDFTFDPLEDYDPNNTTYAIANLNIQVRLLNANGGVITTVNPNNEQRATLNTSLDAGTYYLEIDGAGEGNQNGSGYNEYGSIGVYYISGTFNPGDGDPGTSVPAPSNLVATATSTSTIDLSWNNNATGEESFEIQRSTSPSSGFTNIATLNAGATSYTDENLSANTTYYYRVRASVNGEFSNWSNTANATTNDNPPTIPAPSNLVATATSTSTIDLSWNDNSTGEDFFEIQRSTSPNAGFVRVTTVSRGVTSYTDENLSANTTYYYRVRASLDNVFSDWSNTANATTNDNPPSVPAPSNLVATATSTSTIDLSWNNNATGEESFEIQRSTSPDAGFTNIATLNAGATSYTDENLSANTTYYYRVRVSVNSVLSDWSNTANATTDDNPPPVNPPSNLVATATSTSTIDLSWNDNTSGEDFFEIQRSTSPDGGFTTITTLPIGSTTYTDENLNANTTYYYRVRVSLNDVLSDWSNTDNATTYENPSPVTPPTNLVATATSGTTIDLSWNDNTSGEDFFEIQRSTSPDGGFASITTLPIGSTSYTDENLSPKHYLLL